MKALLIRWLRAWLLKLDPPPVVVPFPALDPLDLAADALIHQADLLAGDPSGEYRRHWVYSRLIKRFPERRKRDVSFAIEMALQARGDG